jgi:hydrogenase expression/formation protein HypC
MCLGIPGQILSLPHDRPHIAVVDVVGAQREVNTGLFEGEGLQVGEWILIHMGFVLERMTDAEARDALRFMSGDESYIDELLAARDAGEELP